MIAFRAAFLRENSTSFYLDSEGISQHSCKEIRGLIASTLAVIVTFISFNNFNYKFPCFAQLRVLSVNFDKKPQGGSVSAIVEIIAFYSGTASGDIHKQIDCHLQTYGWRRQNSRARKKKDFVISNEQKIDGEEESNHQHAKAKVKAKNLQMNLWSCQSGLKSPNSSTLCIRCDDEHIDWTRSSELSEDKSSESLAICAEGVNIDDRVIMINDLNTRNSTHCLMWDLKFKHKMP